MKTRTLIAIFTIIIACMSTIGCSVNSQKPETFKVNADLTVAVYQTEENDGTYIAIQPALLEETVHISELVRHNDDNGITVPFHFSDVERFAEITESNLNRRIAISVNGDIVSTPVVNMKIDNGACSVLLSEEQVTQLFPNIKI